MSNDWDPNQDHHFVGIQISGQPFCRSLSESKLFATVISRRQKSTVYVNACTWNKEWHNNLVPHVVQINEVILICNIINSVCSMAFQDFRDI